MRHAVRGYAVTHPSATVVLPTGPGWDHLLYASAGVMTVETETGTWVVPPHRALWAPDGTPFRIVMHGRVSVRTLYLSSELDVLSREWRVVNVTPLLRELVIHAVRTSPLDLDHPEHARLIGVLVDQLATLPQVPLQLPRPSDPRAQVLADELVATIATDAPLDELAAAVGASRRTLERLFLDETAMTIGQWRQRARLVEALRRLAEGESVTATAYAVGYSTPSAFGAMFREAMGETPGRYFA
ncbi:MAG: helix-turn-helix transcriptional regulator [Actinomycetota bacterium]|nr:helix-turn-helix transcriptional regulator [Actinomycetota bacterium]